MMIVVIGNMIKKEDATLINLEDVRSHLEVDPPIVTVVMIEVIIGVNLLLFYVSHFL